MKRVGAWQMCVLAAGLASGLALAQSAKTDCAAVDDDRARLKCYDEQAGRKKPTPTAPAAAATRSSPAPTSAPPTAPTSAAPAATASKPAHAAPTSAATQAADSPPGASAKAGAAARPSSASTPGSPSGTAESDAGNFGLDPETIRKREAAAHPGAPAAADQIVSRVKAVATKARGQYRITLEDGQVWEETQHTGGEPPSAGDTVTIKRGVLGSYFLSRGSGLALRVKRIS